jgi:hypothetical protein
MSPNKIAVNALNTERKRLENKTKFLTNETETLAFYTQSIYTI